MKKLFLTFGLLFLHIQFAFATTYFVNPAGGSASQCSGLVDAPLSPDKACSLNHPFLVISPKGNNPTKLQSGDTLVISPGDYKIGYGSPNTEDTSKCHSGYPWDCVMWPIPSGLDKDHPTRILGKGWDTGCQNPPQLWGTEKLWQILDLRESSNVEIQCLEITDHSACQFRGPNPCKEGTAPMGEYAVNGIEAADSSNVLLKNVNIHGLYRGIHAGRLKDWTLEDVQIVNNTSVGWDGDIGANVSSNSGTMAFTRVKIEYNGCGETYPGLQPYNCYSQSQGGYGDGLGTHATGGDWIFVDSDISHNTSDGLDLLYHNGQGSVTIKNSRFEGNAGNQVKVNAPADISDTIIGGDCDYFNGKGFTWNSSTFDHCRSSGDAIALEFRAGTKSYIRNSQVNKVRNIAVLSKGSGCDGSEVLGVDSTTFELLPKFFDPSALSVKYWAGGSDGDGAGTCGQLQMTSTGLEMPPPPPPVPPPPPPPVPIPQPPVPPPPCEICKPFLSGQLNTASEIGTIKSSVYDRMNGGERVRFYHSTQKRIYQIEMVP